MEHVSHEDRIGALLGGRYRLESIAAYGGMAVVYSGRHEGTGRRVAVKVLDDVWVDNPLALQRFLQEGRLAAKVRHPNVVDVFDMGDGAGEGCVYVVLELLEGETLAEVFEREGALHLDVAAALLLPLMGAVSSAHARGVVHRDLKPENLFLHTDASGALVPKVVDFGVACDLDASLPGERITRTGDVIGTPAYMSPEQARGESDRAGPAADVWAMGVIWYEALTGVLPFDGPTPVATMVAVNRAPYVPVERRAPALPEAVAAVINRALARDVSVRYPDMGAFLDALVGAIHAGDSVIELDPLEEPAALLALIPPRTSAPPVRDFDAEGRDSLAIPFDLTRRARRPAVGRSPAPRVSKVA